MPVRPHKFEYRYQSDETPLGALVEFDGVRRPAVVERDGPWVSIVVFDAPPAPWGDLRVIAIHGSGAEDMPITFRVASADEAERFRRAADGVPWLEIPFTGTVEPVLGSKEWVAAQLAGLSSGEPSVG